MQNTPNVKPFNLHTLMFSLRIVCGEQLIQFVILRVWLCVYRIYGTHNETCRDLVDSRTDRLGQAKALLTFKVKEKVWPLIKLCTSEHF